MLERGSGALNKSDLRKYFNSIKISAIPLGAGSLSTDSATSHLFEEEGIDCILTFFANIVTFQ